MEFTKKHLMIGGAVAIVVILCLVVFIKKDYYQYPSASTPTGTLIAQSAPTGSMYVTAYSVPAPTPSSPSANQTMTADTNGNIALTSTVPIGAIISWCGTLNSNNQLPTALAGWALCDGNNNTPDLRGRFILGASNFNLTGLSNTITPLPQNAIGGEEFHQLTVEEMPSHTHISQAEACGGQNCASLSAGGYQWSSSNYSNIRATTASGGDATNVDPKTKIPLTLPHNTMPPFYTLCYIMKTS